jgi:hypothetical protein
MVTCTQCACGREEPANNAVQAELTETGERDQTLAIYSLYVAGVA